MSNPQAEITEYHKFVGLFVTQFAFLEFGLRYIISKLAGVSQERFEALVGFPRSGEARAMVKKLADIEPLSDERRSVVNEAFAHLAHIVTLRDRVIHYGGHTTAEGEVMLFTKEAIGAPKYETHELANLWNATQDLQTITSILALTLIPGLRKASGFPHQKLEAWQYKPPPQPHTRSQNRDERKGPQPPPAS